MSRHVGANLTMSWSSFLYNADVWVQVTQVGSRHGSTGVSPGLPTIRPRRLAAELQIRRIDNATVAIRIPYQSEGFRISVEFEDELFDTWNDMSTCCNLTDRPGPGYRFVHKQPRNALLIFAEPMLTAEESALYDPAHDPSVNKSNIGYAPTGDIQRFISTSPSYEVLYFKPGIYYMGNNFSAKLEGAVRWVYLAPGAYVKGAFAFWGSGQAQFEVSTKVTGFGVLSGEMYTYMADPAHGYRHTEGGYGQLKMLHLQCSQSCRALDIHGITMTEPPFYAFVTYGGGSPSGFEIDVAQYKQVGGWYWQTSGIELGSQSGGAWGRGSLRDSFMHCNDDCLILWHSNNSVSNVSIWGE
jgi:hypothetical protein